MLLTDTKQLLQKLPMYQISSCTYFGNINDCPNFRRIAQNGPHQMSNSGGSSAKHMVAKSDRCREMQRHRMACTAFSRQSLGIWCYMPCFWWHETQSEGIRTHQVAYQLCHWRQTACRQSCRLQISQPLSCWGWLWAGLFHKSRPVHPIVAGVLLGQLTSDWGRRHTATLGLICRQTLAHQCQQSPKDAFPDHICIYPCNPNIVGLKEHPCLTLIRHQADLRKNLLCVAQSLIKTTVSLKQQRIKFHRECLSTEEFLS